MTTKTWLSLQDEDIQNDFWKRLSHFLSNRELEQVMKGLTMGRDILSCHEDMGIFAKYQLEVLKLIQTLSKIHPDKISNPIL